MNRQPQQGKKQREATARVRKAALVAKGKTIYDLHRHAKVSYSMAEKWANARRESEKCQRAWERLTA